MNIYGLIGFPLGHSFSAKFFSEKFAAEGIDAEYRNFEIPEIGDLMELLAEYPDIKGFNVTIPYKQQIIPYLTELSPAAKAIGAVNTVNVIHDSEGNVTALIGHNTDSPAFARTLAPMLPLEPVSALILGTGGASHAVAAALDTLGIDHTTVSRTKGLTYADLTAEIVTHNRLIVNTTPLGMSPRTDACPDIPYEALTDRHICYDLIYNPTETLFLKKGAAQGASTKNGLDMLHLQALLAWQIWQK
ncbi:MAG: shikimate dehydrogenase [Bacteroides sp.]|nr:shikimate dehydrogenase [Bacteroides sp.]MCM1379871.1 shikimate dehydrogenase [Bacteroides sp.]MCM1446097.1 shikimate dehydrogenase [Prevotella sp.]